MKIRFFLCLALSVIALQSKAQLAQPLEDDGLTEFLLDVKIIDRYCVYLVDESLNDLSDPNFGYLNAKLRILDLESKLSFEYNVNSRRDSAAIFFTKIISSPSEDTLYILKKRIVGNDLSISVLKTDFQLSFIDEYDLENNISIDEWQFTTSAFIKNGQLALSTHGNELNQIAHNLYYSVDNWEFLGDFPEQDINQYFSASLVNDSLFLRASGEYVYHYDTLGLPLDSISIVEPRPRLGYENKVFERNAYFAGAYKILGEPIEVFSLYQYNIVDKVVNRIFSDTLADATNPRVLQNIDVTADGTIYAAFHSLDECQSGFYCDCETYFRLNSFNAIGELNWTIGIGGESCQQLENVVATPDNGVLLFFKFNISQFATINDVYWIKFNQDGSQDFDYLNDFVSASIDDVVERPAMSIELMPNPASDYVHFEFAALAEASLLRLYDLQGRLLSEQNLEKGQEKLQLDVSEHQSGCYFWSLHKLNNLSRLAEGRLLVD